jgi:HAAS
MQDAGVIAAYADLLGAKLGFDRSLSRRVRQEVEDHLREAAAAVPAGDPGEAERQAIAKFGDPHDIAAQFAVLLLAKKTRDAGASGILIIAGVFAAMKARVAWYAATQWSLCDNARVLGRVVGLLDTYAFWLSVILACAAFAYIANRAIPASFHAAYRRELRIFTLLCTAAAAALAVSVISDGALTALHLFGTEWSGKFLIPIFSLAIEIAGAGILVFQLRVIVSRTAGAVALLKN